jgi:hypothetical protein
MKKFIATSLVALFVTSCGQLNTTASGTGGGGTLMGADRGVIKDAGTTVAKIVAWVDFAEQVTVYIPSADRYATIDLYTGQYKAQGLDAKHSFYYSTANCSGAPVAVSEDFVGEVNKTVIYENSTDSYFLVTGHQATLSYTSSKYASLACDDNPGSTTESFALTAASRPYNFEAIAPLTITYE